MNIFLLISLIATMACLVIADIVYYRNKQSLLNRLYAIFSLIIAYWIFTQEFMCRQATDLKTALFWSKVGGLWLFSAPVFVHFIVVFTEKIKILKSPLTYVILYLPSLFFSFMQITTGLLGRVEKEDWGYSIYNSPSDLWLFRLLFLWAFILVIVSALFLIRFYFQTTDRLKKSQIKFVFIGVIFVGLIGIAETLMVILGVRIADLDSLEMTFLNLCIGYAIWKYQLFVLDPALAAENIIATMPDALLLVDQEGFIVRVNQSLTDFFKYQEGEVVGNTISVLFKEKEFAQDIQTELWKGAAITNLETEMQTALGEYIPVLISGTVVKDSKQKIVGTVYIIRDITERKRNEVVLRNYAEKLKRTNEELQEFIYIASHDLQEPLRKIMVLGDRLKEKSKGLTDQEWDYLKRMQNAAERMRILISDLLIYSRVAFNKQEPVSNDLGLILREVITGLEAVIKQTQGTITIGEMPVFEADFTQMRQLFHNLISNALKYHQPGKPPQVTISARVFKERRRDFAEICVADNGIGIEPANFERVFGIFQRLHGRDEYEGTGIGLAVCKKIVENHQGAIRVESKPGEGSQFYVTLPVQQEG